MIVGFAELPRTACPKIILARYDKAIYPAHFKNLGSLFVFLAKFFPYSP